MTEDLSVPYNPASIRQNTVPSPQQRRSCTCMSWREKLIGQIGGQWEANNCQKDTDRLKSKQRNQQLPTEWTLQSGWNKWSNHKDVRGRLQNLQHNTWWNEKGNLLPSPPDVPSQDGALWNTVLAFWLLSSALIECLVLYETRRFI